jgi:tRNA nucleotidyltransferase (CCA-adding enzyme)
MERKSWEHFEHQADIGVRGFGPTKEEAFAQAALALTAVITDVESVAPSEKIEIACEAEDEQLLFVDWLNALLYEMSTRRMLFSRLEVHIEGNHLSAQAWGEKLQQARHNPVVEVKAATYTSLDVHRDEDGYWVAQCVVDV